MLITAETKEAIRRATNGKIQPGDIDRLCLPESELQLECLLARVVPPMPKLKFDSELEAMTALRAHFAYHGARAGAAVSPRTDMAMNALLMCSTEQTINVIDPFQYGA